MKMYQVNESLDDLLRFSEKTGRKTCSNKHGLWLK